MKEIKVFKILDRLKGMYTNLGVDYDVMKLILKTKLTMDRRRTSTVFNGNYKKNTTSENANKAIIMYVLMGFIMMLFIVVKMNIMYQMCVYFFMFMFFVLTIFISDYASILLDVRDSNIISTKGVSLKTINAAKITHIIIYLVTLTLAMGGFGLIASLRYGILFFLVFLINLILIDLLMIMITALAYFLVLKFFDGEKLKDIINFVQIVLSISMVLMSQVLPRMFSFVDVGVFYTPKLWHYFIAPMWFAAPLEMIVEKRSDSSLIIMTILSLIIPIITICIYSKLTPAFEEYLQKLNNNNYKINKEKFSLYKTIGKIICKDKEERIFYNFTNNLISSEREYKLKVYPNVAMGLVYPFLFMIIDKSHNESFSAWIARLPESKTFLTIYLALMIIPTIIMMIKYSEKYRGAWIYEIVPIKNISSIFKGSIKAIYVKLILPSILILCIIFTCLYSFGVIKHLIAVILASIFMSIVCFAIGDKAIPFSLDFKPGENGGDISSFILTMFLMGIIAGVHFLATLIPIGIYIYIAILLIIDILLWKNSFNISKKSIMN